MNRAEDNSIAGQELPTLDVAVVTWGADGAARVARMLKAPEEGVRYVVSWQEHGGADVPRELVREDVTVVREERRGVSHNRNNALEHCSAEIVLCADDDVVYSPGAFDMVKRRFAANRDVELAVFNCTAPGRALFPDRELDLAVMPKNFHVGGCQLAMRRGSRAGLLRFHPDFGPGSGRFLCGEDTLFLLTARRRGLNCRYYPDVILNHPDVSTGYRRVTEAGIHYANGALIKLGYPMTWPLRIPLKAWRMYRSGMSSPGKGLRGMLKGVRMLKGTERMW